MPMNTGVCRVLLTVIAAVSIAFNLGAEVNTTHVWNYSIEAHARFHIVWQLCSNALISLICVLLLWGYMDQFFQRNEVPRLLAKIKITSLIMLMEPTGFIFAAVTRSAYGGTFFPANVPDYDISIAGIPVALLVFGFLGILEGLVFCVVEDKKKVTL